MARTKPFQPEDLRFIERFSKRLNEEYAKHKRSDAEFAQKLDVSRAALMKYLDGKAMPGVRTVALAYANLNINVSYGKFDAKMLHSRAKSNRQSVEAQLLLPFAIESLTQENIEIELVEKKQNRIAMNVSIRFASRNSA
jgi:transcriptional regulator with XRE-family HTH domain